MNWQPRTPRVRPPSLLRLILLLAAIVFLIWRLGGAS